MLGLFKKCVPLTLMIIGLLCFVTQMLLYHYLLSHSPTSPNQTTGEIYQLNNHGHVFYVTISQGYLQYCLSLAFIVFAFGGAALREHWHVKLLSDNLLKPNASVFQRVLHTRILFIILVVIIIAVILNSISIKL
jgi:hypothetical protein